MIHFVKSSVFLYLKNLGDNPYLIEKGFGCTPEEKKTAGMIGMRFALFSKDNDDLSVTISIEENHQKLGPKCSSGGNLGAKQ